MRNVADFLTAPGEPFVVLAGDALTDVDLPALVAAHERFGGVATLCCKRATNVSELGVVVTSDDGRVLGFQEKPDPAEALSDLANCMMYAFSPEVFDYFPTGAGDRLREGRLPGSPPNDVPFHVHVIDEYWNDVGSLGEFVQGNLDVVEGRVGVDPLGELIEGGPDEDSPASMDGGWELSGACSSATGARIGAGARIDGPSVIGPDVRIGEGARSSQAPVLSRAPRSRRTECSRRDRRQAAGGGRLSAMTARRRLVRVPASSANLGPGYDVLAAALGLGSSSRSPRPGSSRSTPEGRPADRPLEPLRAGLRGAAPGRRAALRDPQRDPARARAGLERRGDRRAAWSPPTTCSSSALERDEIYRHAVELEGHPDNVAAALYGGFVACPPARRRGRPGPGRSSRRRASRPCS